MKTKKHWAIKRLGIRNFRSSFWNFLEEVLRLNPKITFLIKKIVIIIKECNDQKKQFHNILEDKFWWEGPISYGRIGQINIYNPETWFFFWKIRKEWKMDKHHVSLLCLADHLFNTTISHQPLIKRALSDIYVTGDPPPLKVQYNYTIYELP